MQYVGPRLRTRRLVTGIVVLALLSALHPLVVSADQQDQFKDVHEWKRQYTTSRLSDKGKFGEFFKRFADSAGLRHPVDKAGATELEFFLSQYVATAVFALEKVNQPDNVREYTRHASWAGREYIKRYLGEWFASPIARDNWVGLVRNVQATYDRHLRVLSDDVEKRNAIEALLFAYQERCTPSGVQNREAMKVWERFVEQYVEFDARTSPTGSREDFKKSMRECQERALP